MTGIVYVTIGLKGQIVQVNLQLQFSYLDTLHILGQFLATLALAHLIPSLLADLSRNLVYNACYSVQTAP